jgi:glycosyltransferase involved in cell wall biosynthesis
VQGRGGIMTRGSHLKILAIAEHFPSPYKPYHYTQFEQFVAAGHELTVAAFDSHEGGTGAHAEEAPFVRHVRYLPGTLRDLSHRLPALAASFLKRPVASLRLAARAASWPASLKQRLLNMSRAILLPAAAPDVCIVHNLRAAVNLQFLKTLYPQSIIAMYYHGGELPGVPVPDKAEVRRTLATFDVVFTNTNSSRDDAISRGQDPQRIVVSPVGFNIGAFVDPVDRSYRNDGRLNLLMAGRLGEEKGFLYGLQAFKALLDEGVQNVIMRIAGDGPQAAQLKDYVAQNGMSDRVEFLGRVDQLRLQAAYRQADVFLLPSVPQGTWKENQACVVQEAMLMRAVVAISQTGGVPESTAPSMLPYSFEIASVAGITDSLRRLAQLSADELRQLGAQGRLFVEHGYDIRSLNRELLDIAVASRREPVAAPIPGAA